MNNVVGRIKLFAGKKFGDRGVRNPHVTARQAIEIADRIVELETGIEEVVKYIAHHYWYIDKLEVMTKLKGLISDESFKKDI